MLALVCKLIRRENLPSRNASRAGLNQAKILERIELKGDPERALEK